MFKKLSSLLLTVLVYLLPVAATTAHATSTPSPEQVVAEFLKLPYHEIFCKDETGNSLDPVNVGKIFEPYFSKEFYRLFLWQECGEPQVPPHYASFRFLEIDWDFRFGFSKYDIARTSDDSSDEQSIVAKNYRVKKAKHQGGDKATVKVLFDFNRRGSVTKDVVAIYTLIREAGQWKIDDISPKGDGTGNEDEGRESTINLSDSIKAEMQQHYREVADFYPKEKPSRSEIDKVMAAILKLSHYDLSCRDEKWISLDPTKFRAKLEPYFTKKSYQLLLWSQCGEPQVPPHYADLKIYIPWDIRFGYGVAPDTDAAAFSAKNIVVGAASFGSSDYADVWVTFEFEAPNKSSKTETAYFQLKREDGMWKIDDIETPGPHAARPGYGFSGNQGFQWDLNYNYENAKKRYKEELDKKGAASKPYDGMNISHLGDNELTLKEIQLLAEKGYASAQAQLKHIAAASKR